MMGLRGGYVSDVRIKIKTKKGLIIHGTSERGGTARWSGSEWKVGGVCAGDDKVALFDYQPSSDAFECEVEGVLEGGAGGVVVVKKSFQL
jgi:hypothetical protein